VYDLSILLKGCHQVRARRRRSGKGRATGPQ